MTNNSNYRTGIGFDVHSFTEGRKLILGGIEIPFETGLAGHSDADALLHAICDAMLGALALGDIGSHFPDTDPKFKNIDSTILLAKVNELINAENYEVMNVDSVIMLQRPKILPYVKQMREKISGILGVEINQVSVKATTTEKLGFVGRGEGISAMATVLISKK